VLAACGPKSSKQACSVTPLSCCIAPDNCACRRCTICHGLPVSATPIATTPLVSHSTVHSMSCPVNSFQSTVTCLWHESGLVQAALSGSGRYQKYARQFITSSIPNEQCGQYDQLTSQFPGTGPCYAVWAQTYPWFYRSVCGYVCPAMLGISQCSAGMRKPSSVWQ